MTRITDVRCFCAKCDWAGTVGDCEPDVDGDGSLGCPVCLTVVRTECQLQLPAKRVLEGKVVTNPKITLTISLPPDFIVKVKAFNAAVDNLAKVLSEKFDSKARLVFPFEKMENGKVIDGESQEPNP